MLARFHRFLEDALGALAGAPEGDRALALALLYNGAVGDGERLIPLLREFGSPVPDTFAPTAYRVTQIWFDAGVRSCISRSTCGPRRASRGHFRAIRRASDVHGSGQRLRGPSIGASRPYVSIWHPTSGGQKRCRVARESESSACRIARSNVPFRDALAPSLAVMEDAISAFTASRIQG